MVGLRAGMAVVAIALAQAGTISAQGAAIAGLVVDAGGRPLANVQVDLIPTAGIVTVSGPSGAFSLRGVPAGELVVRAQAVGFKVGLYPLSLAAGDSAIVTVRLERSAIVIEGADTPLPSDELLDQARLLTPQLLQDAVVRDFIARELHRSDSLTVWAPWLLGREIASSEPHITLMSQCDHCGRRTSSTLEGGVRYRASSVHVRLGVSDDRRQGAALTFCVDVARPGDVMMANCYGPGRTLLVTYRRGLDGGWILDDHVLL